MQFPRVQSRHFPHGLQVKLLSLRRFLPMLYILHASPTCRLFKRFWLGVGPLTYLSCVHAISLRRKTTTGCARLMSCSLRVKYLAVPASAGRPSANLLFARFRKLVAFRMKVLAGSCRLRMEEGSDASLSDCGELLCSGLFAKRLRGPLCSKRSMTT